jgi:molybdopterin converting factor small subunit
MNGAVIRIPTPLRAFTGGASEIAVEAGTVGEALAALGERHAGILERVLDPSGRLRGFVNVYVGEHDVRSIDGLDTPLAGGEVISIVPAVAGGAR